MKLDVIKQDTKANGKSKRNEIHNVILLRLTNIFEESNNSLTNPVTNRQIKYVIECWWCDIDIDMS